MTSAINQTSYFKHLINHLVCTEKGRTILNGFPCRIKGKERQFLLLLNSDDSLSQEGCLRLIDKIALKAMLEAGLIKKKKKVETTKVVIDKPQRIPYKVEKDSRSDIDYQVTALQSQHIFLQNGEKMNHTDQIKDSQINVGKKEDLTLEFIDEKNYVEPPPHIQVLSGAYVLL